jgi:ubiquinone/menaquinone biosynthesis C-methylase UbiE
LTLPWLKPRGCFLAGQPVRVLGHTSQAIQRLLNLAQIYQPFTRRMLVEAGITTGMQVLDVGCGPGDVSLLIAELVGETGSVLGIDASEDMLQVA